MNRKLHSKIKSIIVTSIMVMAVVGCARNPKVAECKVGEGADCKSVTEVNQMVNSGELERSKLNPSAKNTASNNKKMILAMNNNLANSTEIPKSKVIRLPEKTAKIWMAGFEDEMGDYVKETYVYTVLDGGKWLDVQ